MKSLIVVLFLITLLNSKEFYYSFINDDKTQISEINKNKILSGNYKLETIKRLVREGQLDDAYKRIVKFKEKNKIKLLESEQIVIYADILNRRGGVKYTKEAVDLLEKSINESKLNQDDLLEAYKLLVILNIKINKPKEAKHYVNTITKVFDDPISKAFGQIALSQIDIHKRQYGKAIKILYQLLVKTNNIDVATIVADELFDAYMLNHQRDKAYELASKVLQANIQFYAKDSFLALKKVDKLIDADMPEFAIDILKMLLDKAVEPESIDRFKFRLANTYMKVAGQNKEYMNLAKELYKDLLSKKGENPYYKQVRMTLDEILMREGSIEPSTLLKKYSQSEAIEQKVLLQELINASKKKDYSTIQRMKRIYSKISDTITQRYGYNNIQELIDEINADMIKYYLQPDLDSNQDKCLELSEVLSLVTDEALKVLIKDNKSQTKLFNCLIQIPDERSYNMARSTFNDSKDAQLYLYLERISLLLNKIDDAYEYIQKIDMVNDYEIKSKEFLYRFLVYGKLNNKTSMNQFFRYTSKYPEFIEDNENNPLIIDFYYQYYLYLQEQKQSRIAFGILNKLFNKQKEMKAYVYSPFVELELVKELKLDEKYDEAIILLQDVITHTRSLSDNNLANIYYEMAKIYEKQSRNERYKDSIIKCKELKNADNFYKKMCDNL
jgi:hypothetical protein